MNFKESVTGLIDHKLTAVLGVFIRNPNKEYCLNEVTNESKVPVATTHRMLRKLLKLNLIKFNNRAVFNYV